MTVRPRYPTNHNEKAKAGISTSPYPPRYQLWRTAFFLYICVAFSAGGIFHATVSSDTNEWARRTQYMPEPAPTAKSLRRREMSDLSPTVGWNPVNVYYGQPGDSGEKDWFSQVHQDEIFLSLLGPNGFFIDLAANDAVELSNTLALERRGGWKGICVEPNPRYWYGLASYRTCDIVGALVGGRSDATNTRKTPIQVKFRGVFGGIVGKMDEKLANRLREPDSNTETRYMVPFRELLELFDAPTTIDYLSLDVEGSELLVMQDFPFDDYRIRVTTVERPSKELKALFNSHGYIFLKDLSWWGETLWAHESTGITADHPIIAAIVTDKK